MQGLCGTGSSLWGRHPPRASRAAARREVAGELRLTASLTPGQPLVTRFAADLGALIDPEARLGVAVSGGPDSLALLLLAAAARPGLIEAATVDHGLRSESRSEAEMVAAVCDRLSVPHAILAADRQPPRSNWQAWARALRYELLGDWAGERGIGAIATAHHRDDQAETLLMRIARGSGVGGLAGIQRRRPLDRRRGAGIMLVRPLLDWRRGELSEIVDAAGLEPADDPSNSDERFDRTQARSLLQSAEWLDASRLAAVAGHCSDAEDALDWTCRTYLSARLCSDGDSCTIDTSGVPHEFRRRLLMQAMSRMTDQDVPGPQLSSALRILESGGVTTLAGLKLEGGALWRISTAPPRRR